MKTSYISNIKNKNINIYFILFFIFALKSLFEFFVFDYKVIGDTSVGYFYFQYLFNNFSVENKIISWIEFADGGYPNILNLKFWNSFLIYPFLLFSYFIKNPYIIFQLYLGFIYILLLYSIQRNLFLLNLRKCNQVFIIISLLALFTLDFNYMHQHLISSVWLLYVIYRIQKYFLNFKIVELNKILIFGSIILYMHPTYLNIIYIFYSGLLFFLIYSILNFKKIKSNFKIGRKDLYFFLISCFVLSICYLGLDYERNLVNIISSGRQAGDLKVEFESWLSLNNFNPKVSLGYFFYQEWIANYFPLNISTLGIFLLFYFILSKNKKIFYKRDIIALTILILIFFYFAHFAFFYIFKNYISKFLYDFVPFINYTRNFIFVLYGAKCLLLIVVAFILDKFLSDIKKFALKDFLKIVLIFFLFYSEFLFSFFYNSVDKKIFFYFLSSSIIFFIILFLLIQLKQFNNKTFLFAAVLSILCIYISNFYGDHYSVIKPKQFQKFDKVYFSNNINLSDKCFSSKDINKIYDFYLSYKQNRYVQKWNDFFLNTEHRPCDVVSNIAIVSKYSDLDSDTIFKINATKEFSGKNIDKKYGTFWTINSRYWERPNHSYKSKENNYFVSDVYTNQDGIYFKRLSNSQYLIEKESNINEISTKIRYDKHWTVRNSNGLGKVNLVNDNGFLKILNIDGVRKILIKYDNIKINIINHVILIFSLILNIYILIKINKKNN